MTQILIFTFQLMHDSEQISLIYRYIGILVAVRRHLYHRSGAY